MPQARTSWPTWPVWPTRPDLRACRSIHVHYIVEEGAVGLKPNAPLFQGVVETNGLVRGSWGAAAVEGVEPQPGDHVVEKMRMNGFFQTRLDILLRGLGVDSLIIAGCYTNMSIEHTARHGADAGYTITVVSDGTSTIERRMAACGAELRHDQRRAGPDGRRGDRRVVNSARLGVSRGSAPCLRPTPRSPSAAPTAGTGVDAVKGRTHDRHGCPRGRAPGCRSLKSCWSPPRGTQAPRRPARASDAYRWSTDLFRGPQPRQIPAIRDNRSGRGERDQPANSVQIALF